MISDFMKFAAAMEAFDRQQAFAAGFAIAARDAGLSEDEYSEMCKVAASVIDPKLLNDEGRKLQQTTNWLQGLRDAGKSRNSGMHVGKPPAEATPAPLPKNDPKNPNFNYYQNRK